MIVKLVKEIKYLYNIIKKLSNQLGVRWYCFIIIPLICIGFNDFPQFVASINLQSYYVNTFADILSYLTIGLFIFSDKRKYIKILLLSFFFMIRSVQQAVNNYNDSSLCFFTFGLCGFIIYMYEGYLLSAKYDLKDESLHPLNVTYTLFVMVMMFIYIHLCLDFSKYFLNTFLKNYYVSLKENNNWKSSFVYMLIYYKFQISLLCLLVFVVFILNKKKEKI